MDDSIRKLVYRYSIPDHNFSINLLTYLLTYLGRSDHCLRSQSRKGEANQWLSTVDITAFFLINVYKSLCCR